MQILLLLLRLNGDVVVMLWLRVSGRAWRHRADWGIQGFSRRDKSDKMKYLNRSFFNVVQQTEWANNELSIEMYQMKLGACVSVASIALYSSLGGSIRLRYNLFHYSLLRYTAFKQFDTYVLIEWASDIWIEFWIEFIVLQIIRYKRVSLRQLSASQFTITGMNNYGNTFEHLQYWASKNTKCKHCECELKETLWKEKRNINVRLSC